MAETQNRVAGKVGDKNVDASVAARTAARKITAEKTAKLSDRNKWALSQLRAAKAAINAAQDALLDGREPSAPLVSACQDVSRSAGAMMFQD